MLVNLTFIPFSCGASCVVFHFDVSTGFPCRSHTEREDIFDADTQNEVLTSTQFMTSRPHFLFILFSCVSACIMLIL